MIYSVELDERLAAQLTALFERVGSQVYVVRHFIGVVHGKVRVEVRANEHPPPHFHITYDGEDASYDIRTGKRLPLVEGLEKYDQMVHVWWKSNRIKIANKWNSSRPSDCPVGSFSIPSEWTRP
jgi:Domain of unknown function (DUF4160)